jgi:hypothetical protein
LRAKNSGGTTKWPALGQILDPHGPTQPTGVNHLNGT